MSKWMSLGFEAHLQRERPLAAREPAIPLLLIRRGVPPVPPAAAPAAPGRGPCRRVRRGRVAELVAALVARVVGQRGLSGCPAAAASVPHPSGGLLLPRVLVLRFEVDTLPHELPLGQRPASGHAKI